MAKGKKGSRGEGKGGGGKARRPARARAPSGKATKVSKGSNAKAKKRKGRSKERAKENGKAATEGPGPETGVGVPEEKDQDLDIFDPPAGDRWTSPVSYDAKSFSSLFRQCLDELGFRYSRKQADKMYTQTMVLFPLPKSAYVYRFEVSRPIKIWVDFYDTKPSHAGIIPYMDIHGVTPKKMEVLRQLLEHMVAKLSRPPWQFTIGQRLQHGLLIPEWGRAKKAWRRLGFRLEKWKEQR